MTRRYWNINLEEMMEAGVHFGHGTRKWNPRMAPYISAKWLTSIGPELVKVSAAGQAIEGIMRQPGGEGKIRGSVATNEAYGLLEDDSEWNDAMKQASEWANPASLRELFVTLILLSTGVGYGGGAASDHLGEVVLAFCGGSEGIMFFSELEAIEKGLQGCQLHGFWRVEVSSNYLFREYQ
ncbi:hypothetical protein IFM89_025781 [Coptis chinensis]|uniref:Ribosomal protein S2 n=1 Tax=Coptis chinensis TaxID=261450 RepID=A0A835LNS6_9MAGN|nr:hypothetical protein IFM89_025781 [Coptis chinensis]